MQKLAGDKKDKMKLIEVFRSLLHPLAPNSGVVVKHTICLFSGTTHFMTTHFMSWHACCRGTCVTSTTSTLRSRKRSGCRPLQQARPQLIASNNMLGSDVPMSWFFPHQCTEDLSIQPHLITSARPPSSLLLGLAGQLSSTGRKKFGLRSVPFRRGCTGLTP
jgi:hypothetical protein